MLCVTCLVNKLEKWKLHWLEEAFRSKEIGQVSISEDVFGCMSQSQSERGRERGREVKGRMIKRSPRTASVLRYSTRTKHYKLNRIWAFGIRKIQYNTIQYN